MTNLTEDRSQAIRDLSERKLTEKQCRFAVFLADYIEGKPKASSPEMQAATVLDATREFNAIERARKETEPEAHKPPKLRVIQDAIEQEAMNGPMPDDNVYDVDEWAKGLRHAKGVVERYA